MDYLFPKELGDSTVKDDGPLAALAESAWSTVASRKTGYIESIDGDALLAWARDRKTILRMERGIGEFVVEGAPLVSVAGSGEPDEESAAKLKAKYFISRQRSVQQDAGFGIRQIVDIAMKALSPGVNDTTTAVMCVDYLGANRMVVEQEERNLIKVHPVVFRARPIATLVIALVGLAAVVVMIMSVAGMSLAGYALGETMVLGPATLLTWFCAITLLVIAGVIGYWMLLSQFTTLTVTDDRTIYQEGIVSRETSEVQHDDVRNIQLDQSFMQRIVNVGGIGISSSGQDDMEIVAKRLPHPKQIIDRIRENQT